jgi:hypothetical protein
MPHLRAQETAPECRVLQPTGPTATVKFDEGREMDIFAYAPRIAGTEPFCSVRFDSSRY